MPALAVALAVVVLGGFVALAGVTTYRYGRRDLLHPIVLTNGIMAYFVLIPAAYFLATGMDAVPAKFNLAQPARSLAVALVLLLVMYVFILLAFRRAPRVDAPTLGGTFGDANPVLVLVFGCIGFGIGLLVFAAYVVANGGPIRMLTVTPRTAFQVVPNTYRFRIFGLIGVFGGYATILCALRPALERRRSGATLSHLSTRTLALTGTVTALTMAVAISTRARMVILIPALVAIIYFWTAGWLPQRALVGVGAVVVTMGVGFSAIEGLLSGFRLVTVFDVLIRGVVQLPRLALVMVLVERVPGEAFFQFGATIPEAFYIDLPGDPRYGNILERIATGTDTDGHTVSAMLPGELWLNFGPVGIAVGALAYGAALGWIYRLREHASPLVRGVQPVVFVCVLLLWPTNLTWGVPNLLVRVLLPVLVAVAAAVIVQRWFPSVMQTLAGNEKNRTNG